MALHLGHDSGEQHYMMQVREAAKELGYQADETFCLKISQLREIFQVTQFVCSIVPWRFRLVYEPPCSTCHVVCSLSIPCPGDFDIRKAQ